MVALAVPRFGFVPEPNLARLFLHRALEAEEAGRLIEAGCLLREAVARQLAAMCHWYGCLPKNPRRCRPMDLARALREAKACDAGVFKWFAEAIDVGNRAAHCRTVDRDELRGGVRCLFYIVDADPCGEPRERFEHLLPAVEASEADDDDDRADDWKKGGAA